MRKSRSSNPQKVESELELNAKIIEGAFTRDENGSDTYALQEEADYADTLTIQQEVDRRTQDMVEVVQLRKQLRGETDN